MIQNHRSFSIASSRRASTEVFAAQCLDPETKSSNQSEALRVRLPSLAWDHHCTSSVLKLRRYCYPRYFSLQLNRRCLANHRYPRSTM